MLQQNALTAELIAQSDKLEDRVTKHPDFGRIASAIKNDKLVVATPNAVYLHQLTNGIWAYRQKLNAHDTWPNGDFMSVGGVGIGDDFIAVGSHAAQNGMGSIYIFVQVPDGSWVVNRTLMANDAGINDHLGSSLAVYGRTIVTGAPGDDDKGDSSGSAYVFKALGNTWIQQAKLTAQDGAALDLFGSSIGICGDAIAVGARGQGDAKGAVYVFVNNDDAWPQEDKLVPAPLAAGHHFGISLALEEEYLVVGANGDNAQGIYTGAAYVFQRFENLWIQQDVLRATDATAYQSFGKSVTIDGNLLTVGAPADERPPGQDQLGAAYTFGFEQERWRFSQKLQPSDPNFAFDFGASVTANANQVAIGSPLNRFYMPDPGVYDPTGAVYMFYIDFQNTTNLHSYVSTLLYWPEAFASRDQDPELAAFRYKHLLYEDQQGTLRAKKEDIDALYGAAEGRRAAFAEDELLKGLLATPSDPKLGNLLLDIYHDRVVALLIKASLLYDQAAKQQLAPPSNPLQLVIYDEVSLLEETRAAYRKALDEYFKLLSTDFGTTNNPPLGYSLFKQYVPSRGQEPASRLEGGKVVPVSDSTNLLFHGYKDLTMLYGALSDSGRTAASLARLLAVYDQTKAQDVITAAERFLYLHTSILKGIFPELKLDDASLENSGLPEKSAAIDACLTDLENLKQSLTGDSNPLGFEDDFLMLVQKFAQEPEAIFDSFDVYQQRLNPADLSSPLGYALTQQEDALESYADYRGFQDQLETQLDSITGSAEDRLFQICGAYPGTPEYEKPESNDGCEIWLQRKSIETAKLQITRNGTEISNLEDQVSIEVSRSQDVQKTVIDYGDQQADLTEWIALIKATQAACDASVKSLDTTKPWGTLVHGANAAFQFGAELGKGFLEGDKEQLAAEEESKIEGINSQANVETLLLGMKTLAIDSQAAAILLKQEVGRLAALYREKEDLERTLAESKRSLAGRYFADPTHHLRYQHQTLLANLSFDEAQKWVYFMARALEYKWNTPFMNYFYLGRKWSTDTLFKLRNAEELEQFYNAMVSFNGLVQLPQDDYFDWFSVREDFLGYRTYDDTGTNLLYYVDPAKPEGPAALTAIEAFRSHLRTKRDAIGNIKLEFSTRREIPGGTFYRGARFDDDRNVLSAGLFLDKIKWLKITLPGAHSLGRSQVAGELSYGGTSFIRNFDVGTFHPERPDRLQNEETAYSTRYWYFHAPSAKWRFSESLSSPVTMQLSADPRVPPSVREIDVFKERSVATTGWKLKIPTEDLGVPVLEIDEIDDIELYFYHYAVSRQMPAGEASNLGDGINPAGRVVPFPYNLRYD